VTPLTTSRIGKKIITIPDRMESKMPLTTGRIGKKIIIIPARMHSRRFPGKPMAEVKPGIPLVRWVYHRALKAAVSHVVVATPDREIARYCQESGMVWRPTRPDHFTGTHRCAEVLQHFKKDIPISTVMNWQVDEPLVDIVDINKLLKANHTIATLVSRKDPGQLLDRNVTKTAFSEESRRCHWFSRAEMRGAWNHTGVYTFDPGILEILGGMEPTLYSEAESLEQLAWIENGHAVYGVEMDKTPQSVDTPEDLEIVKGLIE